MVTRVRMYRVKIRVQVIDENGNKIVDLAEDKYIDSEMLEALREEEQ